jgi:hypothetical protein
MRWRSAASTAKTGEWVKMCFADVLLSYMRKAWA